MYNVFDNDYHSKEESVGVETTLDLIKTGQTCKVVKILGNGALSVKVEVEAHAFSKSAEAAIVAAGGSIIKL